MGLCFRRMDYQKIEANAGTHLESCSSSLEGKRLKNFAKQQPRKCRGREWDLGYRLGAEGTKEKIMPRFLVL